MPRQLTPEETKIIRQTEEEGARLARQQAHGERSGRKLSVRILTGTLVFIAVFAAFACIAYAIVSGTAR